MVDNLLGTVRYLAEALRVRRCHAEPVLHQPTIGEHTCGVALMCLLLTDGQASRDLLVSALTHDLGERRWGDVPGNVKKELGLDEKFDVLERGTLHELGLGFRREAGRLLVLSPEERATLHLADKLDLMLHCCMERAQGNQLVISIWHNCLAALQEFRVSGGAARQIIETVRQLWRQYDEQGH